MMRAAAFSLRGRLGARASGPHRAIHITQSGKGRCKNHWVFSTQVTLTRADANTVVPRCADGRTAKAVLTRQGVRR